VLKRGENYREEKIRTQVQIRWHTQVC